MKKAIILLAVISFALCSCDGNGKNQNNGESTPQQNEQTIDTPMDIGDAALFKPEGTAKDLFPDNCDTVCFQQGDLNNDGIQDLVICSTPRNPENMMTRDDGYEYNFNEPVLAIYFGQDGEKYSLFKEYPNTIPGPEDEFGFVTVGSETTDEGDLKFDIEWFYSAGSSAVDQNSFLYRYQDGDFYLIGSEVQSYSRMSGEAENVSKNYLTKKQLTTTFSMKDDNVKPTETWLDLPDEPLEKLGAQTLY